MYGMDISNFFCGDKAPLVGVKVSIFGPLTSNLIGKSLLLKRVIVPGHV